MSEEQINKNINLLNQITYEKSLKKKEIQEHAKEKPKEILETPKEKLTQEMQADIAINASGIGGVAHIVKQKQKHIKEIESIMEKGVEKIYTRLTPKEQKKFKLKGEKAALKINKLLNKTKIQIKKIIKLLRNWLSIIPGVNKFFLEQSSKIKADEIIKLKQTW